MNTARGGLLDYDAVVDALEYGHLGAAAFDVFDAEPLPAGSRLRTAPRVVLTPHLAGATRQTAERAARQSADAAAADWLAGWLGADRRHGAPRNTAHRGRFLPGRAAPS